MSSYDLPQPEVRFLPFWQATKEHPLTARCIRDNPPRKHVGFGRDLRNGDTVEFTGVCWNGLHYEIAADKELSFYQIDYFELIEEAAHERI